jgi:hypothetical protein
MRAVVLQNLHCTSELLPSNSSGAPQEGHRRVWGEFSDMASPIRKKMESGVLSPVGTDNASGNYPISIEPGTEMLLPQAGTCGRGFIRAKRAAQISWRI